MIQFTIDSFSGGLSGRPYNSIKDAIQDGGYSVWCNEKIKKAFSFGNGTEKDFERYCKDNKCKIVSESEFYIVENSIGSFQKPIIPGDCPTFLSKKVLYLQWIRL